MGSFSQWLHTSYLYRAVTSELKEIRQKTIESHRWTEGWCGKVEANIGESALWRCFVKRRSSSIWPILQTRHWVTGLHWWDVSEDVPHEGNGKTAKAPDLIWKQNVWMIAKLVGNKNDFQDFSEMEERCFPQPKHDMQCWPLDINRIPYQRSISSFCHWTISIVCFCLFVCSSVCQGVTCLDLTIHFSGIN